MFTQFCQSWFFILKLQRPGISWSYCRFFFTYDAHDQRVINSVMSGSFQEIGVDFIKKTKLIEFLLFIICGKIKTHNYIQTFRYVKGFFHFFIFFLCEIFLKHEKVGIFHSRSQISATQFTQLMRVVGIKCWNCLIIAQS